MNINIRKVLGNGDLENERVILDVIQNDLLGIYLVLKSKELNESTVNSRTEGTYWFPDKDVKQGDLVVLYTKKGVNTEKRNEDGTTTYFFYWNMDGTLWNNPEDAVILSRLESWSYKKASAT